jgi:hypothetical protein
MMFLQVAFDSHEKQRDCNMRYELMRFSCKTLCNAILWKKFICIHNDSSPTNQKRHVEKDENPTNFEASLL